MKRQYILTLCTLSALLLGTIPLEATKKKPFKNEEEADHYLTKHYNLGCKYYNNHEWRSASNEFEKVIYFFPSSDAAAEASYFLSICYFEREEYDFANSEFSSYLKASQHPEFFEDAVYYKFCIAERLKNGKRRRPFTNRYLPKCMNAEDLALTIYDEVVAALPNHELTIQALYSKADLLMRMGEYRLCVDTYQIIVRRFPKNDIVPVCYVNIANAYVEQSRYEFQNPDILALAELNARKFSEEFPRDENVPLVNDSVMKIKELYAKGLCDLGLFYERIDQPEAAIIYFQSSIEEFPDTHVAEYCRSRILILRCQLEKEEEKEREQEEALALAQETCEKIDPLEESPDSVQLSTEAETVNINGAPAADCSHPLTENYTVESFYTVPVQESFYEPSYEESSHEPAYEPIFEHYVEPSYTSKSDQPNEQSYDSSLPPYFKQSEESMYVPSYESPYEKMYKSSYVPSQEQIHESSLEQSYDSSFAPYFKQTGQSAVSEQKGSEMYSNPEVNYTAPVHAYFEESQFEQETQVPQKEEPLPYIHYSLIKKRDVKYAPPKN